MSVFRLQENTPEVYTNTSRDFQLIERLYDCVINGIRFDVDSILNIVDTNSIDSKLLSLLQTKIGFFTQNDITDDDLRYILKAFPVIVKNKGSLKGIEGAVNVFLKLKHVNTNVYIKIFNKQGQYPYIVQIGLNMPYMDTALLDEILKYVLPTGYVVSYMFNNNEFGTANTVMEIKMGANIVIVKDSASSIVRGSYIAYINKVEDRLIGSVGETQSALPYDSTYMGVVENVSDLPEYEDDYEKHVGETYILRNGKPWDSGFSLSSYMYMYIEDSSSYGWKLMNSSADTSFDVLRKSVYGYYNNNNFYETMSYEYSENAYAQKNGISITDDSTPDNAVIEVFPHGLLYSPSIGILWYQDENTWEGIDKNLYGVEIDGNDPNEEVNTIIPKIDMVVYRRGNTYSTEALWKSVITNNSYMWLEVGQNEIDELKVHSDVIIEGDPDKCKILYAKDNCVFNKENDSWYLETDTWIKRNLVQNSVEILGNPNTGAKILPNENVHVYNNGHTWVCDGKQYSDEITPQTDALYIDYDTNNGYRYNSEQSKFEQVIFFIKANNVYEISADELEMLIEQGVIKPAFKDETTIFTDNFDSIFLL